MVEMTDSTVLVERKTSYSEVLKQGPKKDNETNKQYLNGGVYFRRMSGLTLRPREECISTCQTMKSSPTATPNTLSWENRKDVNGNIGVVQNGDAVTDTSYEHQEIASKNEYNNKETGEKVSQVNQLESALSQRKNSVQRQLSDLSESLKKAREETNKEMEQLKKDLEARRHEYITDINNIHLQREEQKRKFEEELEEFQNEEKLEERRQRYHEHEALITKQELELEERKKQAIEQDREIRDYEEYLNRRHAVCNNKEKDLVELQNALITKQELELEERKKQAIEQDREIRDYEEYLNRRHAVCNSKEKDLVELQNDLDTLSQELEAKRERLLNKSKALEQNMQQATEQEESGASAIPPPPLVERRSRSASRVSGLNRGTDMRIEELKYQNKQLLEELFTLKKAVEAGNEREAETHQTMEALAVENKRLTQKVKHLETQLELARKSADLASDSSGPSVDEILRKTTADMRNSRVGLRPSRMSIHSNNGSHARLAREPSKESVHSKGSGSSDSVKNSKSSKTSKSPVRGNSKDGAHGRKPDDGLLISHELLLTYRRPADKLLATVDQPTMHRRPAVELLATVDQPTTRRRATSDRRSTDDLYRRTAVELLATVDLPTIYRGPAVELIMTYRKHIDKRM
ncbi:predicted protein [Nematostella vectensis]|uniref:Uncharacterized protein n=1 Tax=Nematostella vectensis TaxID=45351 RepID=A7S903_NEMVE|nr:predicted protein [Nematostella vectensis]|eukprot:XP_001631882.1 predicted protein [Nematostella vectensis]